MKLRFIGSNQSMGLTHGAVYDVEIYSTDDYIWVKWNSGNSGKCPYISLQTLMNNWELYAHKEAISVMKKAYDTYNTNAQKNLDADNDDMYWYWKGIAEGTRMSWELIEELFDIEEET